MQLVLKMISEKFQGNANAFFARLNNNKARTICLDYAGTHLFHLISTAPASEYHIQFDKFLRLKHTGNGLTSFETILVPFLWGYLHLQPECHLFCCLCFTVDFVDMLLPAEAGGPTAAASQEVLYDSVCPRSSNQPPLSCKTPVNTLKYDVGHFEIKYFKMRCYTCCSNGRLQAPGASSATTSCTSPGWPTWTAPAAQLSSSLVAHKGFCILSQNWKNFFSSLLCMQHQCKWSLISFVAPSQFFVLSTASGQIWRVQLHKMIGNVVQSTILIPSPWYKNITYPVTQWHLSGDLEKLL